MKILIYPNNILETKCKDVEAVNEETKLLVDEMVETMYKNNGIGLAAPQVGVLKNIIVFDCSDEHDSPTCLINPKIVRESGTAVQREGCLSFPGIFLDIRRSSHITVNAIDLSGKESVHKFSGLESACVQHEIDHLQGQTLLNKVNRQMRRKVARMLRRVQ